MYKLQARADCADLVMLEAVREFGSRPGCNVNCKCAANTGIHRLVDFKRASDNDKPKIDSTPAHDSEKIRAWKRGKSQSYASF